MTQFVNVSFFCVPVHEDTTIFIFVMSGSLNTRGAQNYASQLDLKLLDLIHSFFVKQIVAQVALNVFFGVQLSPNKSYSQQRRVKLMSQVVKRQTSSLP